MPDVTLFINTNSNQLMGGLASTQTVDARSIPFFYNDTIGLSIYNLTIPAGYNPGDPSHSQLAVLPTAGRGLWFYIDDGTIGGSIYASQLVFDGSSGDHYVGSLALTSQALHDLIGTGTGAPAWLKIGYTEGGIDKTVLSAQISIGVGKPTAAIPAVAQGLTALSLEAARQLFFPIAPVNGQALYLSSPTGKVLGVQYVDNADGTASLEESPQN